MELQRKRIKKIAVFRALQLGDMLCIIPTLRALRAYFPNAEITLIGLPWVKDFTKRFFYYINNFIEFPGFPSLPERKFDSKSFPKFTQRVQNENFDLLFQLHGAGVITNPLISHFNAKIIAGYYTKNNFCPSRNTFFIYPEKVHEVKKYLKLLNLLGIPSYGDHLEFPITENEKAKAEKLMAKYSLKKKTYALFHPGAREMKRRSNKYIFSDILDSLKAKETPIMITGTLAEYKLCSDITKYSRYKKIINLAGKTDLGVLAYLISNALLVISSDTGISHIAAALDTPSIVLFTHYSSPRKWGPLDKALHIPLVPPYSPRSLTLAANSLLNKNSQQKEVYVG